MSADGSRLRYGGAWFSAASSLELQGGLSDPRRLTRLVAAALIRPWRLAALLAFVLAAPRLRVRLSDSASGNLLRDYFSDTFLGVLPRNRLCRGVLVLPARKADYLRGSDRHALRNNLSRAARAGICCGELTDAGAALAAMQDVMLHRASPVSGTDLVEMSKGWSAILGRREVTAMTARDPAGTPLAVAAVVVDDEVCLLRLAVAMSHEARWALHHHLVELLIDRGARYLVSHADGPFGALGSPPNIQYYQQLLGYQVCHIGKPGRSDVIMARWRGSSSSTTTT